jgi:3-oxoacyl-[acyl-carrier-protein] synthase-3
MDSSIYIPEKNIKNDFFEKKFALEDGWIEKRTGIMTRNVAHSESTSDLAVKAIIPLLERNKEKIDFILCATSTADSLLPSTANKICDKLHLNNTVFCFDIMAACSGFLFTLAVANSFINSGLCKTGIIVGAEKMATIIDQDDSLTSPLFGDAAGAFLIGKSPLENKGIVSTLLESDSTGVDKLFIKSGGSEFPLTVERLQAKEHYVTMHGRDVFINATKQMTSMIEQIIEINQLSLKDIHYIIPHQANKRISEAIYKNLGCPAHITMCNIIEEHGNIVNASIPVAYHLFKNQIGSNKNVIFVSFGAGFNYGAHLLRT